MTTETTIPEGMKEWHGGDEAPADWARGTDTLLRNGVIASMKYWPGGWKHRGEHDDIIAYTPKARTTDEACCGEYIAGSRCPACPERTTDEDGELLPCPWPECDGTGPCIEYDTIVHADGHATQARVECNCGACGPSSPFYVGEQAIRSDKAKAEATRLWNTRTSAISALPAERVDRMATVAKAREAYSKLATTPKAIPAELWSGICKPLLDVIELASALPGDAGLREALVEQTSLIDRLCDAFDRADDDIGGESPRAVLALLGPCNDRCIAALGGRAALQTKGGDDRGQ